jgi:formamidopyrimidine-DNA glycosylase
MPEMPELEVLCERLGPAVTGRAITGVAVSPKFGFLLRTPPDDLSRELTGKHVKNMWRRGKFLAFDVDGKHLVINPMLGGRLFFAEAKAKPPTAWLFTLEFDSGQKLALTDFARMARVYLVAKDALDEVPGWSELGPDANTITLEEFQQRIKRHPGELKNLLRNQAFVAGIGNAYSDEILHEAQLLPLRKRSTLKPEDIERLHAATLDILARSAEAIRQQPDWVSNKQDRSYMHVHLRGGEACPRCGHRIAEIKARGEVFNFCRACQK